MRVKDIMTRIVVMLPPECSVEVAAEHMKKENIGLLPIGDKDKVLGVITDRDITIRVTAEGRDPRRTRVREVMTPNPSYTFEDEDIEDACLHMQDKHVRRLMVLNRSRDLVGVLSLDDVAVKTRKNDLTGYVLSKVATR